MTIKFKSIARLFLAACLVAMTSFIGATASAQTPGPNDTCLMCHNDMSAKGSTGKVLGVDKDVFKASVHGSLGLKCVDCHGDEAAAKMPHAQKLKPVNCANCHEAPVKEYESTVHGKSRKGGNDVAATCASCHGTHDILRSDNPKSRTNHANLEATCATCHGNDAMVTKSKLPGGNIESLFHDSIHGRNLRDPKATVSDAAPTCTNCHGAHNIESKTEKTSRIARANIPDTCGGCHQRIKTVFDKGKHGQLRQAGSPAAPNCIDCHSAHTIQKANLPQWQLAVIGQCGNCHSDLITTYRSTFHGQVTELGYANVATCAACHGAHDVLPASDPASRVSAANRVETCRACHPKANVSFAQFDPHANRHDKERSPLFYYMALFMDMLLLGVFAFFGIHTLLWFARSMRVVREQKRNGGNGGKSG